MRRGRWPWLVAIALTWAAPAAANTLAGVELAPDYRFDDGTALPLHGAGLREKYLFDIYVGALYLPETGQSVEAIRTRDQPGRVEMHFVYDEVARDKLVDAWRSGFEANNDADVLDTIDARVERFIDAMPDAGVAAGDTIAMTYRPGKGTRVAVNGSARETIAGGVFFRALLAVFVGPEPPDADLRRGMLGQ